MRKIIVPLILFFIISVSTNAQIFNTGQTLKKGQISLGFEPAILIETDDFILFVHGGIGLKPGIDFGLKAGFLNDGDPYFGGDVEFALGKYFSVMGGAHHFGNFGLDGCILGTYPIQSDVRISSGLDMDINFSQYDEDGDGDEETNTDFLLWLPISLEIGLRSNMAFIFEAEVGLTDPAYHLIGGGLSFYF